MPRVLSFAVLIGPLFAALPDEADACGPPACIPSRLSPGDGELVPSNAAAVAFHPGTARYLVTAADPLDGGVIVLDSTGAQVALSVEEDPDAPRGFLLHWPLVEGETYSVFALDPCREPPPGDGGSFGKPVPLDGGWTVERVTVGTAAPTPSSAGTLAIVEQGPAAVDAWTPCGSCTRPRAAARVALAYAPSAELTPWLPVTRFDLSVDGQRWHGTDYGELDSDAGETWTRPDGFRTWREVFATCDLSLGGGEDEGVPVGHHVAVFQAHVAGAAIDPAPLSVEFDLDCTGWQAIDAGPARCSAPDAGAGVPGSGDVGVAGPAEQRPIRGCFDWLGPSAAAAVLVSRVRTRKR